VDEEGRRSRDAARIGAGDVLGDALGVLAPPYFPPEAVDVEADLRRDAAQLLRCQCLSVGAHGVVHLPEATLRARRLDRLGGQLRVGVHVAERQMTPRVAQVVAEVGEQLTYDRLGAPTVWTLEVAVLEQRDGRVQRPADVVAR